MFILGYISAALAFFTCGWCCRDDIERYQYEQIPPKYEDIEPRLEFHKEL